MKFDIYDVSIDVSRIIGGIPVVPEGADRADAYEGWARGAGIDPENASDLAANLAEEGDMPVVDAADAIEGLMTGFRRDEFGLYIEARQVKAMLREAFQRLGLIKKVRGTRQVLQHDLHVRALRSKNSQKLYLLRGGPVSEPDGTITRPISVVTRQGPRTALKRTEHLDGVTVQFSVYILKEGVGDGIIGEKELREALELGGWIGIGADRSQGEGTFELTGLVPVIAADDPDVEEVATISL